MRAQGELTDLRGWVIGLLTMPGAVATLFPMPPVTVQNPFVGYRGGTEGLMLVCIALGSRNSQLAAGNNLAVRIVQFIGINFQTTAGNDFARSGFLYFGLPGNPVVIVFVPTFMVDAIWCMQVIGFIVIDIPPLLMLRALLQPLITPVGLILDMLLAGSFNNISNQMGIGIAHDLRGNPSFSCRFNRGTAVIDLFGLALRQMVGC